MQIPQKNPFVQLIYTNAREEKKETLRFHLTQSEWLLSRKQTTANADEDVGEKEPLCIVDGNAN
jgi:hypothetical protein